MRRLIHPPTFSSSPYTRKTRSYIKVLWNQKAPSCNNRLRCRVWRGKYAKCCERKARKLIRSQSTPGPTFTWFALTSGALFCRQTKVNVIKRKLKQKRLCFWRELAHGACEPPCVKRRTPASHPGPDSA